MIVNPNNTNHTVKITPRFYPTNDLLMRISNTFKGTSDIVSPTYNLGDDNKLALTFDYDFSSESNYNLKIIETVYKSVEDYILRVEKDNGLFESKLCIASKLGLEGETEVLFRTNILATTQTTQDYSLTAAKYNWK